jgi:hypothetical protein
MHLAQARVLAGELVSMLAPVCDRIEVAGGIRRGKLDPHDIELVAVPKVRDVQTGTLDLATGAPHTERVNGLDWFLRQCFDYARNPAAALLFKPAPPNKAGSKAPFSERYYRFLYKDEPVDLFCVLPPAQWGVIFTLRTGDAGFSHDLVSRGWPRGLFFIDGQINRVTKRKDGSLLTSRVVKPGEEKLYKDDFDFVPIPTPEELDVFRVLDVPWVPPEQRVTGETTVAEWEAATT